MKDYKNKWWLAEWYIMRDEQIRYEEFLENKGLKIPKKLDRPHKDIELDKRCPKCGNKCWMQNYYDDVFCDKWGRIGKI